MKQSSQSRGVGEKFLPAPHFGLPNDDAHEEVRNTALSVRRNS